MEKEIKWIINDQIDQAAVERLSAELGIDAVLSTLLVQRGITTFEQAYTFFRPKMENLHDPFLMKDMDSAVERINLAISKGEKILVYGDYDVDGTTAVSLVYSFLKKQTGLVDFYIPDRYNEGYGVSKKGIDWAFSNGIKLIITLDCGIKSVDEADYAASKGIDMIICDHHLPDEFIPRAVAVLDPKRSDCGYPFDDLSGCGVGFKLIHAYSLRNGLPFEDLIPYMDLLVVSIAADLVSVVDENRILAYYGLQQLNKAPRKGLEAIMNLANIERGHITIEDIVFKIGPRINAAGRIETGGLAVELLTAEDDKSAIIVANKINDSNNERKNIDREITGEALEMVQGGKCISNKNTIIVYSPEWNKGVVGIVASRLVEAYYKPSFVLTKSNGFISGSARSIKGFDLYDAIERNADLLENFGGHMYAAGLTIKEENLEEFACRIEEYIDKKITPDITTPVMEVNACLNFSRITPKFFRILKQFQPFGPGNQMPVFMTENVYDDGSARKVGPAAQHLKLSLMQESQPYNRIASIGFNMSEYFSHIKDGNPFDICYSIVENYYRGSTYIQLRIRDIKKRNDIL